MNTTAIKNALSYPKAKRGDVVAVELTSSYTTAKFKTERSTSYYLAKAIARDQNRSLGRVVGDLILQSSKGAKGASIEMSAYGFPTFRCARPVTTEDVKALDDEE